MPNTQERILTFKPTITFEGTEPNEPSWFGGLRIRAERAQRATTRPARFTRTDFTVLANKWKRDTGSTSSVVHKIAHPSFLAIIRAGEAAIPYILEDLRDDDADWFIALNVLTGVDAASNTQGSLRKAVAAWLEWGRRSGYDV